MSLGPTLSRRCCPPPIPAGETISEEYITEYSTDKIEMHVGAVQEGQRVLLVRRPSSCECRGSTGHPAAGARQQAHD